MATLKAANCEVAFDNLTRQLYATDASLYQIEPLAVAFPKNAHEAGAIIQAAAQAGTSVIPRGAGTGLSGGAIGDGLVVDFARHNRHIGKFNMEKRTVRVGAGVVLDQLNQFLHPQSFRFGPDVATSSRATLGGMIANDSSGSHAPVYGTTAQHVSELDIVPADGQSVKVAPGLDTLAQATRTAGKPDWIEFTANRRAISAGSFETLAGLRAGAGRERTGKSAPHHRRQRRHAGGDFFRRIENRSAAGRARRGLAVLCVRGRGDAGGGELLDLNPAAVEHIDRPLLDQTRGQREFQAARDLLELDAKPCEAILIVEFFEDIAERLALLEKRKLGLRRHILQTGAEADLVWSLRKAGLSLLTSCKGDAKPVPASKTRPCGRAICRPMSANCRS